jgi:O-succinylbenzoic acid--CoA ligase
MTCPELQGIQVIHVDDLPKDSNPTVNKVRQAENNEILSIMFTSGTTGKPKAVAQTYLNHHASALGCAERFHYDGSARWLFVNPIYHISGLSIIFRAVITGAAIYMVNKFDEDTVIRMIQDHHITHTSLVPVMLERLMKKEWTHELEGILLGGAGVDTALMKRAIDRHLPIHNSFGMTETCSQIVSISYDNDKILKSTVGRPPNNVEIKVDDNNELLVKADNVTPGYLNASIDIEDGYFRTGDLAEIDEAGYLYILDRRKDLIISGGENIYPKEIEDVVNRVAGVERSVVVKKKDSVWGEVPVLLVEGQATLSAIEQTLFTELAKYKQPKEIHFVETVYMTSTGKVSRAKNKEIYEVILGQ